MKFSHLLLALLLIGMPFMALAQENVVDEQEQEQQEQEQEQQQQQQEVPPVVTDDEVSGGAAASSTSEANGYVHLVIRRSFVNKTFSETIPALIRVQIFNLGTA